MGIEAVSNSMSGGSRNISNSSSGLDVMASSSLPLGGESELSDDMTGEVSRPIANEVAEFVFNNVKAYLPPGPAQDQLHSTLITAARSIDL